MTDHGHIISDMVGVAPSNNAVTITETNFGYIIWSQRSATERGFKENAARFGIASMWVAIIAFWLLPFAEISFWGKAVLSMLCLGFAYVILAYLQSRVLGAEMQVDTARREIRTARRMSNGQSLLGRSFSFGDVKRIALEKRSKATLSNALTLNIAGEARPMVAAIGDFDVVKAIYARLTNDLRPIEERLSSYQLENLEQGEPENRVFPPIGPISAKANTLTGNPNMRPNLA